MNIAIDAALHGMQQASELVDRSAQRLARVSSHGSSDVVSLSDEMLALITAKHSFTANARVLQTAEEIQKQVVDLLA